MPNPPKPSIPPMIYRSEITVPGARQNTSAGGSPSTYPQLGHIPKDSSYSWKQLLHRININLSVLRHIVVPGKLFSTKGEEYKFSLTQLYLVIRIDFCMVEY